MRGFGVRRLPVGLAALLLVAGCGSGGRSGGGDGAGGSGAGSTAGGAPTVVVPPPTATAEVTPEGFSAAIIDVTQPDGTVESFCVWLAETSDQRQRGLMAVTSLGGADGMLFRFGTEHSGSFWMKDTVLPLSIAFFAGDGAFVSATDMEPCAPGTESCPLYGADGPYADAIEVVQGGLPSLGIGPGSRLAVTEQSCQPSGP